MSTDHVQTSNRISISNELVSTADKQNSFRNEVWKETRATGTETIAPSNNYQVEAERLRHYVQEQEMKVMDLQHGYKEL